MGTGEPMGTELVAFLLAKKPLTPSPIVTPITRWYSFYIQKVSIRIVF